MAIETKEDNAKQDNKNNRCHGCGNVGGMLVDRLSA